MFIHNYEVTTKKFSDPLKLLLLTRIHEIEVTKDLRRKRIRASDDKSVKKNCEKQSNSSKLDGIIMLTYIFIV